MRSMDETRGPDGSVRQIGLSPHETVVYINLACAGAAAAGDIAPMSG